MRSRRSSFVVASFVAFLAAPIVAHDAERTAVAIEFERDGAFIVSVSNDPGWLKLRLASFDGPFPDRVVMWVDGREVRPTESEYVAPRTADDLASYRLRGRVPIDSHTLRWYYGMVADPYPLTVRRADGRVVTETVAGDAWSRTIDISGQFAPAWRVTLQRQAPIVLMVAMFGAAIGFRIFTAR